MAKNAKPVAASTTVSSRATRPTGAGAETERREGRSAHVEVIAEPGNGANRFQVRASGPVQAGEADDETDRPERDQAE
jgi:hypothetical protein